MNPTTLKGVVAKRKQKPEDCRNYVCLKDDNFVYPLKLIEDDIKHTTYVPYIFEREGNAAAHPISDNTLVPIMEKLMIGDEVTYYLQDGKAIIDGIINNTKN